MNVARIVRVHDVGACWRALQVADAVRREVWGNAKIVATIRRVFAWFFIRVTPNSATTHWWILFWLSGE
jgi:hypothetical protein